MADKARKVTVFKMSCKKCKYTYKYCGEKFVFETCPICGYCAPFEEFCNTHYEVD